MSQSIHYLPCDPPRPCPPILTASEAVLFLRLDVCSKNPLRTLEYYRSSGELTGTRLGRAVVYRLEELLRFAEERQNAGA
jgi:hypothetical protein